MHRQKKKNKKNIIQLLLCQKVGLFCCCYILYFIFQLHAIPFQANKLYNIYLLLLLLLMENHHHTKYSTMHNHRYRMIHFCTLLLMSIVDFSIKQPSNRYILISILNKFMIRRQINKIQQKNMKNKRVCMCIKL